MISFKRILLFFTGTPFIACLFFSSMFYPVFGLLIAGKNVEAIITLVATVSFIFIMVHFIDTINDLIFVILTIGFMGLSTLIYGLLVSFTISAIMLSLQTLTWFIVTSDTIRDINNDVGIVITDMDALFNECKKIEESNNKT